MNTRLGTLLAAALLTAPVAGAQAQDGADESAPAGRGNSLLQVGIFHVDTLDSSQPLHSRLRPGLANLAGVNNNFDSAGTSATVSDSNTLALITSYFVTDHIALKFEAGVPARFKLYGNGSVSPTGPAGALFSVNLGDPQNNPLAKVTQRSPVFIVNYYFRNPEAEIRPYVGLGVTYTWFRSIGLDKDFQAQTNQQFGRVLALSTLNPGPTHVGASAADDVAPVFNVGLTSQLSQRWSLSGSVSFIPLKTTARIKIDADNGNRLDTSTTRIDLDPLVVSLLVGYRFNLKLF